MNNPSRRKQIAEKLSQVAAAVSDLNASIQQELAGTSAGNLLLAQSVTTGIPTSVTSTPTPSSSACPLRPLGETLCTLKTENSSGGLRPSSDSTPRTPYIESRFYRGPMNEVPPSFFERSEEDFARTCHSVQRQLVENQQSDSFDVPLHIKEMRKQEQEVVENLEPRKFSFKDCDLSTSDYAQPSVTEAIPETQAEPQEETQAELQVTTSLSAANSVESVNSYKSANENEALIDHLAFNQELTLVDKPLTKEDFLVASIAEILERLDAIEQKLARNGVN